MSQIYNSMKRFICLILLIILVSVLLPKYVAKASHIMGGDMNYQYIGFDTITGMEQYQVNVIFYRDVTGISCPGSVSIRIWEDDDGDPLTAINLSEILGSPVTFNQSSSQILIPGQGCFGDSSIVLPFDIELCTYSGIIEVPPSLFGYHITTGTCCRNAALDNLVPDNMTCYFLPK